MPVAGTGTSGNASLEIQQSLYKNYHPAISVLTLNERDLTHQLLDDFSTSSSIGLAGEYKSGHLVQLTLAIRERALLIRIVSTGKSQKGLKRALLGEMILINPKVIKVAFNLDRLSLALHTSMDLRITNGVDLLTLWTENVSRTSLHAIASLLYDKEKPHVAKVANIFETENFTSARTDRPVLRAWSGYHVTRLENIVERIESVSRIDTSRLEKAHLDFLSEVVKAFFQLEALKPIFTKNDISEGAMLKKGWLEVTSTRFKTRLRSSSSQTVHLEFKGRKEKGTGHVNGVRGKNATISTKKHNAHGDITAITTVGKEEASNAESKKVIIILETLQGRLSLFQNAIVRSIWFSDCSKIQIRATDFTGKVATTIPLNRSQLQAVKSMLRPFPHKDAVQVTMVHGPPGSGKTSVAAGFVQAIQLLSHMEYGEAVYLTAQSNVAVKNIAEKLHKIGFTQWKLLVSHDFHFDWHEHLYEKISQNVIESSELPKSSLETERLFRGVRVILCTLSMFSNVRLAESGLTRLFPLRTVVVDEASQIEISDYLPVFHTYAKTLRRICFVGDDKQLAPYGQEDIPGLRSIFEMRDLRRNAIFLDIQYRMPRPIGEFISHAVYDDVDDGIEMKDGHSWKNMREVQIVVHLVRQAHKNGEDFRVITPYDAQRNFLEAALKTAQLPWKDRCFNVDSFQGNEADHIIVSIVRTKKPGFLNNERRTNVLLTRCKKKMTICSNRQFLESEARKTLVGRMVTRWGATSWISRKDVLNKQA